MHKAKSRRPSSETASRRTLDENEGNLGLGMAISRLLQIDKDPDSDAPSDHDAQPAAAWTAAGQGASKSQKGINRDVVAG